MNAGKMRKQIMTSHNNAFNKIHKPHKIELYMF